jgi:hypothetical protein
VFIEKEVTALGSWYWHYDCGVDYIFSKKLKRSTVEKVFKSGIKYSPKAK